MRPVTVFCAAGLLMVLFYSAGCGKKESVPKQFTLAIPPGLEQLEPVIPVDNPLTQAKVVLGRKLFFDERLSLDATVSCATCHIPLLGYGDGRTTSMGVYGLRSTRNAPTLINRVFGKTQFWDGRAASLEEVVLEHMVAANDMRNTPERLVSALTPDETYSQAFTEIFGAIAAETVAQAVAAYVRTIVSGDSPYDRFMAGNTDALDESAQRGMALFNSERTNCATCHAGPNFTDEQFHSNGAGMDSPSPDPGRVTQTGNESERGRFKTPTLRDVTRTAPYMHDGSLRSLKDVIRFYNQGGIAHPNLSAQVKPLHLSTQEQTDLINFLRSLRGSNSFQPGSS